MKILLGIVLALVVAFTAQAQSITYQGKLTSGGAPVTTPVDIRFRLHDAPAGPGVVGPLLQVSNITPSDGLFSAALDFGPGAFTGQARFLEISVTPAGANAWTVLTPRQPVTAAPHAIVGMKAGVNTPASPGALRYVPSTGDFQGYNGGYWVSLISGAAISPGVVLQYNAGSANFIVPPNVTSIGVDIWGGGGNGGISSVGGSCSYCNGGGGGGSGRYARVFIDVTPGETLTVVVGNNGQSSSIKRGSTDIVVAGAGTNGLFSNPGIGGSLTFNGPGRIITQGANNGFGGTSGSCGGFPPSAINGIPGPGGQGPTSAAPLSPTSAGEGGDGASACGAAEQGQPGKVLIFYP